MTEGKKTYYQVSFTGGQALAAVIVVILALGLSFFFGARAGFERSGEAESPPAARGALPAPTPAAVEPTASTSPKTASASSSGLPMTTSAATEEAPVFEDREAGAPEEPKPASKAPGAPSRTQIAGSSAPPGPKPSKTPAATAAPGTTSSPEPATSSAKPGFFVQVISTSSKSEATRWKERLAGKSYRTAAVTSVDSKKGRLFRVRTGPYPDRAQAKKVAAKISAEFKQKAWVAVE